MQRDRSLNLDILRLFALLMMFINHLGRFFPAISGIVKYTFSALGINTSAEIFIAISAFAIFKSSMDSTGKFYNHATLHKKAVKRFFKLYLYHIVLLSIVILMSLGTNWQHAGQMIPIDYPPLNRIMYGSIFLFQPALFDILPLYMFFTLLNPLLIRSTKLRSFRYIFGVSFIIWMLVSIFQLFRYERFTVNFVLPFFHLGAWQFLYCCLIVVFLLENYILLNRKKFFILSSTICAVLFIYPNFFLTHKLDDYYLTSRQYMGPLRLLGALSWSVLMLSIRANWRLGKLSNIIHWVGRNALPIFSLHVVVFYVHKFYIYYSAYYWGFYPQLFTYLALVFLPFTLVYIGGVFKRKV